jgi:hypothetical protein
LGSVLFSLNYQGMGSVLFSLNYQELGSALIYMTVFIISHFILQLLDLL